MQSSLRVCWWLQSLDFDISYVIYYFLCKQVCQTAYLQTYFFRSCDPTPFNHWIINHFFPIKREADAMMDILGTLYPSIGFLYWHRSTPTSNTFHFFHFTNKYALLQSHPHPKNFCKREMVKNCCFFHNNYIFKCALQANKWIRTNIQVWVYTSEDDSSKWGARYKVKVNKAGNEYHFIRENFGTEGDRRTNSRNKKDQCESAGGNGYLEITKKMVLCAAAFNA